MYVLTNGTYYYSKTGTNKILKVLTIEEAFKFNNIQQAQSELNRATSKLKNFRLEDLSANVVTSVKHSKRKQFTPTERKEVYRKSKGNCCLCGNFVDYDEFTVDHIIPLAKGGTNEMSNLQCACKVCNNIKTDVLPNEFIDKITEMLLYNLSKNKSRNTKNKLARMIIVKNLHKVCN